MAFDTRQGDLGGILAGCWGRMTQVNVASVAAAEGARREQVSPGRRRWDVTGAVGLCWLSWDSRGHGQPHAKPDSG